ncbi:COG4315 family predicted lipoprotein [Streptomyces sp. NPDC005125]
MNRFRYVALLVSSLLPLGLLTLTACDAPSKDTPSGASTKIAGRASSVRIADSPLGRILVDDSGRTLYAFTKDKPGESRCDDDCIAVWPALIAARDVTPGAGVDAGLLKEIRLSEGAEQATYGNWPLYYYVGDTTAGDVNGQGLDQEWFAIGADGKLVKKQA